MGPMLPYYIEILNARNSHRNVFYAVVRSRMVVYLSRRRATNNEAYGVCNEAETMQRNMPSKNAQQPLGVVPWFSYLNLINYTILYAHCMQ